MNKRKMLELEYSLCGAKVELPGDSGLFGLAADVPALFTILLG